jgi:hypothetical protein
VSHRSRWSRPPIPPVLLLLLILLALPALGCAPDAPEGEDGAPVATAEEAPEPAASTTPATRSDGPDACALLPKAEAEAILGLTLRDPEPATYNPVGEVSECVFETDADPSIEAIELRVAHVGNPEASYAELEELFGTDGEVVEDLGDRAIVGMSQLFTYEGDYQVVVLVTPVIRQAEARRDTARRIAEIVLEGL